MVFHSLRHTSVTYKLNEQKEEENKITIPEGVGPELLMKVLGNPEMAALLTSLAILCGVRNLCSIVFFVSCEKTFLKNSLNEF